MGERSCREIAPSRSEWDFERVRSVVSVGLRLIRSHDRTTIESPSRYPLDWRLRTAAHPSAFEDPKKSTGRTLIQLPCRDCLRCERRFATFYCIEGCACGNSGCLGVDLRIRSEPPAVQCRDATAGERKRRVARHSVPGKTARSAVLHWMYIAWGKTGCSRIELNCFDDRFHVVGDGDRSVRERGPRNASASQDFVELILVGRMIRYGCGWVF